MSGLFGYPEENRLKVVIDGSAMNTTVSVGDRPIEGVTSIRVEVDAYTQVAKAVLTVEDIRLDADLIVTQDHVIDVAYQSIREEADVD